MKYESNNGNKKDNESVTLRGYERPPYYDNIKNIVIMSYFSQAYDWSIAFT